MEPDERFTDLYRRHHRAVWAYATRRLRAPVWSAAQLVEAATDPAFTR